MVEPSPSPGERILDIANTVALKYGKETSWSTWHFWDFYRRRHRGGGVADQPPVSGEIWRETKPFGSCVDIALQTTAALKNELSRISDLQHYAEHVRTLARAGSSNQQDELTHSITALLANEFCVVIDFSCNHKAMLIPYRSCVESQQYHNMHGNTFMDRLMYDDNLDGVRTVFRLQLSEAVESSDPVKTPFQEYDEGELIERINIRLAMETNALGVPKTKSIKFQTVMSHAPELIPWAQFDREVLATTCRVKVDFENRRVLMQVPYRDWLVGNRDLLHAAHVAGVFNEVNPAACNLKVELECHKHCRCPRHPSPVHEQIEVLARIGERHGLERGELHRWIDSIYEVHHELRFSRPPG